MDEVASIILAYSKAYSKACQISKMERFGEIFKGEKTLTIFAKRSVLDVWRDSKDAFDTLG